MTPLTGPDDPRHGTLNRYNYWRCRCERCRAVNRERTRVYLAGNAEQRAKRVVRARQYRAQAKAA
jgi:hypothetical protein